MPLTYIGQNKILFSQQSSLVLFDGTNFVFTDLGDGKDIIDITNSSIDKVWLATRNELFSYSIGDEIEAMDMFALNAPFPGINRLDVDLNNSLWISSQAGLRKLENGHFSDYCEFSSGFPTFVTASTVDGFGNLWSYSHEGTESYLVKTNL